MVHLIFNSVSFLACGLYLERKIGSLPMLFLIPALALFGSAFMGSVRTSTNWTGFSVANYALFGFILVNYLFSMRKERRSTFNTIYGSIILGFIYFLMCADYRRNMGTLLTLGTYKIGLCWYPIDLLICDGHMSGFMAGFFVSLVLEIYSLFKSKLNKQS